MRERSSPNSPCVMRESTNNLPFREAAHTQTPLPLAEGLHPTPLPLCGKDHTQHPSRLREGIKGRATKPSPPLPCLISSLAPSLILPQTSSRFGGGVVGLSFLVKWGRGYGVSFITTQSVIRMCLYPLLPSHLRRDYTQLPSHFAGKITHNTPPACGRGLRGGQQNLPPALPCHISPFAPSLIPPNLFKVRGRIWRTILPHKAKLCEEEIFLKIQP